MRDRKLPVRLVCRDGDHDMCPHEPDAPWCGCSCHTDPTADRDDLAAILAKHREWWSGSEHEHKGCSCDTERPADWHEMGWMERSVWYRAHVAQMVLESDWLRERDGDKWDQGYRSGASNVRRQWSDEPHLKDTPNPYRADRVDAEDTDNTTDRT